MSVESAASFTRMHTTHRCLERAKRSEALRGTITSGREAVVERIGIGQTRLRPPRAGAE